MSKLIHAIAESLSFQEATPIRSSVNCLSLLCSVSSKWVLQYIKNCAQKNLEPFSIIRGGL